MKSWSWKEAVVFAVAGRLLSVTGAENAYEMSFGEKLGSRILKPLYRLIELVSKKIKLPLAISLFTILAAFILLFVFYNIPAFIFFGKVFPTWLIRPALFFYVELNLLAMGCKAFGRFNNRILVEQWKRGQLIALMPGDYEIRS